MFECPNCKETLGDDIDICPFCRHEITTEEHLQIERQKREEEQKASAEESIRTGEFSSLRIIWQACMIGTAVLAFAIYGILLYRDPVAGLVALIAGIVLLLGVNVYFLVFKKANCCPHCGKYLFRNWGTQCQWCGRSIR